MKVFKNCRLITASTDDRKLGKAASLVTCTLATLLSMFLIGRVAIAQTQQQTQRTDDNPMSVQRPQQAVEEAKTELVKLHALAQMLAGASPAAEPTQLPRLGLDGDSAGLPPSLQRLKQEVRQYESEVAELYNRIYRLATRYALILAKQTENEKENAAEESTVEGQAADREGLPGPPALFPPSAKRPETVGNQQVVDPVRLADLLFRSGDFQAAYTQYKQVADQPENSQQRQWVTFQLASCLRRMGKLPEAAAKYRELLAADTAPYLTEAARWHLSVINWRLEAEGQLRALQSRRLEMEKALNDVGQRE